MLYFSSNCADFKQITEGIDTKWTMAVDCPADVYKRQGYGHGAEAISRLIEDYEYIWGFATATAEEAIQLKDAGIEKPVLILGLVFEEYFQELIRKDVRLTVCEYDVAKILSDCLLYTSVSWILQLPVRCRL